MACFLSAIPLPPLPELTPKAEYPSVKPSLYLPLWDVLQYLNEVSTPWRWNGGLAPGGLGERAFGHRVEMPSRTFYWEM